MASVVIFVALSFAPGDPAVALAGPHATPGQLQALREQLGEDQPLLVRYVSWLGGILHGDFGQSTQFRQDVSSLLQPRIGVTVLLVTYAFLLILHLRDRARTAAITSPLSDMARRRRFQPGGGGADVRGSAHSDRDLRPQARLVPGPRVIIGGTTEPNLAPHPPRHSACAFLGGIRGSDLPGEHPRGGEPRACRDGTAAAAWRGGLIFRKHVLRNAAVPIVTVVGLTLAGLVAGSIVVETAFGIGGIGSLLVVSVSAKDTNVVLAISIVFVVAFVVATTIADIAQILLDPRVRDRVTS